MLKKIVLATSLLVATTSVVAEEKSDLFFGVDYISANNSYTAKFSGSYAAVDSADLDSDASAFRLKFGTKTNDGIRILGHLTFEDIEKDLIFEDEGMMINIGVEAIKAFEVHEHLHPFIGLGVGYGFLDLGDPEGIKLSSDSLAQVNISAKAGVYIPLNDTIELEIGAELVGRKYQSIELMDGFGNLEIEMTESSTRYYGGLNIHF